MKSIHLCSVHSFSRFLLPSPPLFYRFLCPPFYLFLPPFCLFLNEFITFVVNLTSEQQPSPGVRLDTETSISNIWTSCCYTCSLVVPPQKWHAGIWSDGWSLSFVQRPIMSWRGTTQGYTSTLNLSEPEPTLNALISSFQRDSPVSRALSPPPSHLPWLPMPSKGGWTWEQCSAVWPGSHQPPGGVLFDPSFY